MKNFKQFTITRSVIIKTSAIILSTMTAIILLISIVRSSQKPLTVESPQATIDSLQSVIDSLQEEHFVKDIQIMRYEYIFEQIDAEIEDTGCLRKIHEVVDNTE